MSTLAERINLALSQLPSATQAELARHCGISTASVNNWFSGETKSLRGENLVKAAEYLKVLPLWLSSGRPPMRSGATPDTEPGDNRMPIRRALFKLSAGVSGYEIEYENGESEPIFMARRWFEQNHYKPEKLIALKVNGRSMEPKMYDGDLVIVNTENTVPKDGVVFAINYEGEMVIKRMKRDSGRWLITSDNPDKARFSDKVCAEACYLLGEVVYLQTETV